LDGLEPNAIAMAKAGNPVDVRFKGAPGQTGFCVQVFPASTAALLEPLALHAKPGTGQRGRNGLEIQELQTATSMPARYKPPMLELTVSELQALDGCLRRFHWTRIMGYEEPGRQPGPNAWITDMQLGLLAHQALESGNPSPDVPDLGRVLDSPEWKALATAGVERELPFVMQVSAGERQCRIRGRMDAIVPGRVPAVIDYKYAEWQDGRELDYEIQMTAYSLALMKVWDAERSSSELWYLKNNPIKIVKTEYVRVTAEHRLGDLLAKYDAAVAKDEWTPAERSYCDRVHCGFRSRCWRSSAP
jgi:hypothetical protein